MPNPDPQRLAQMLRMSPPTDGQGAMTQYESMMNAGQQAGMQAPASAMTPMNGMQNYSNMQNAMQMGGQMANPNYVNPFGQMTEQEAMYLRNLGQ